MPQKINGKDISVVLQGPIYKSTTEKCLASLRKHLPECEIILSTWDNSDIENLDYDIVVLSQDPGSTRMLINNDKLKYNINRQIISTQAGLAKVTRKYVLKFRTDFILKSSKFLNYMYLFPHRIEKWKITEERIIMPMGTQPYWMVFHPTDVLCFGLTQDVKNYWSCKLPSKEFSEWFLNKPLPLSAAVDLCMKIGAEPYIWSELLRKYQHKFGAINFKHSWDNSNENIELSKITLANNTIMLDRDQFEFETPEHPYLFNPEYDYTWINHDLWKLYYIKFCKPYDSKYQIYYDKYNDICKRQSIDMRKRNKKVIMRALKNKFKSFKKKIRKVLFIKR